MTELKVTIDDREVEVEKGTGLVETAASAGIEIPVFCYEPRLGPPSAPADVPRRDRGTAEAAGGLHARGPGGMVVRTAATSERAAAGQQGTSSSSSSTTRSTARSATRAASARCRT